MIKALIAGTLVFLSPHLITAELQSYMIVWNVGQGQWITRLAVGHCDHFDAGGEFSPLPYVRALCSKTRQRLWLSHWDFDHTRFALALKNVAPLCAEGWPSGVHKVSSRNLIKTIPLCRDTKDSRWIFQPNQGSNSNSFSRISISGTWLIPGDSPAAQEKKWAEINELSRVRTFVASHHGSQTANSVELLRRIPRVRQVIISARRKRYGHPHLTVMLRLKAFEKAPVKTEDWGHMWFAL